MTDSATQVEAAAERLWEATSVLSAAANRIPSGASASIVQQSSGPILIVGSILAIFGVSLLAYHVGVRKGDAEVAAIRERQVQTLEDRVSLLETYQQQNMKRLSTLEAKATQ